MTISEAIEALERLKTRHGDVQVYFDCPKCGVSFAPDAVATVGVHLKEKR